VADCWTNRAPESGDSLRPVSADIKYVATDFDFVPTYGMHVLAGRHFSRAFGTDTTAFMLNAAAARALGLQHPEQAVGRNFEYGGIKGRIVGVLDDFHFESMHQQIVPLVFAMTPDNTPGFRYNFLSVKIAGNNITAGIAHLEKTWKKYLPQTPFEYTFLDEKFQQLYRSEQKQGTLFTSFSGIAIFIACLGLLGLSAFAISQRIKEIGVRKVLGASTSSIVTLLSKDFLKLVAIAAIIAFPVAWYAMHNWLTDFAYRISIQWWIFLVAGILASAVALITIGFQAIRAAMSPPVKSLRTE
jgi:putative ABC transport system permease protein